MAPTDPENHSENDSTQTPHGSQQQHGGHAGSENRFFLKNISPPGHLKANISNDPNAKTLWMTWKRAWNRYLLLSGVGSQPKPFIAALLLHSIGPDGVEIYEGFSFENETDNEDPAVIIKKYDEYFVGASRDFIERMKFYRRKQLQSETFEQFLNELRQMSKSCGFCACMSDIMIMDRIMDGHKSLVVKEKLIAQEKADLNSVINTCRAMELTEANLSVVKDTGASGGKSTEEVNKVGASSSGRKYSRHRKPHDKSRSYDRKHDDRKYDDRKYDRKPDDGQKARICKFCGQEHIFRKSLCPAWGKTCNLCKGENHFSSMCPKQKDKKYKSKKTKIHAVNADYYYSASDSDDCYSDSTDGSINTVIEVSSVNDKNQPLYAKMIIDNKVVVHQIDPGATACIIPASYVGDRPITKEQVTLRLYDNSKIQALGRCKIKVRNAKTGKKWNISYVVIENESLIPLLSRQAAELMSLITVNYDNFVSSVNSTPADTSLTDLVRSYPSVFNDGLGSLSAGDDKVHLTVKEYAKPVIKQARNIPEARKQAVKSELQRMEREGIIEKVDKPTDWVNQMAVVDKKDGSVRICLDPRALNNVLKREHYKLPVLDSILPEMAGAKLFSVFDLKQGYLHLKLDEESSLLTTFATPFGRYRWMRLPFGLNISSEIFQKKLCQALDGLSGTWCIADDIIIAGTCEKDHHAKIVALLQRCSQVGIKLNNKKCQYKVSEVKFLGHIISANGLKPDPEKVKAIAQMPVPDCKESVERLKGMVAYLSRFLPKLSSVLQPLLELTRKDIEFCWDSDHDKAFQQVKALVVNASVLKYFDPVKSLVIQCDASAKGLGAVMLQDGFPIAYGSRTLTNTETRYSVMEKEMLAIVFALEKWHQYTYGRSVIVQSDHKPLETITKKPLDQAPRRLQLMLLRALAYDVTVQYLKGDKMMLADTLSRASIPHNKDTVNDTDACIHVTHATVNDAHLQELREATSKDNLLKKVKKVILDGASLDIGLFSSITDELAVENDIIMKGSKIVVPQQMRQQILELLHVGHQAADGCLRHAREYFFWPGMSNDISLHVSKCQICQENGQQQQKETLQPHNIPDRPFQKVGVDLFSIDNKDYMVTVCYLSNFFEIDRLYQTGARTVVNKLKAHCARYGIPDTIVSDCGPQFTSELFTKFTMGWGIEHIKSSPHYPKSNGKAESAVKAAKKVVQSQDPFLALLNIRNTPQQGFDLSPAQRLFNRRTRTLLPVKDRMLENQPISKRRLRKCIKRRQEYQRKTYNKNAKDLAPLKIGDTVRIKPNKIGDKIWIAGKIVSAKGRSYEVRTQSDKIVRRNRVHLRLVPNVESTAPRNSDRSPVVISKSPTNVHSKSPKNVHYQNETTSFPIMTHYPILTRMKPAVVPKTPIVTIPNPVNPESITPEPDTPIVTNKESVRRSNRARKVPSRYKT